MTTARRYQWAVDSHKAETSKRPLSFSPNPISPRNYCEQAALRERGVPSIDAATQRKRKRCALQRVAHTILRGSKFKILLGEIEQ